MPQRRELVGWTVSCPFCFRRVLPTDGLFHLAIAPRLAYHLWDEHPYEARILQLHLADPSDEWPEIVEVAA